MTLMTFVYIVAGLVLLVAGAEVLVRGAAKLAAQFGIPPLIIGLTVVAFGTSAPETAVSVQAALDGSGDLAIGNVVGSNIFNILFVLGVAAAISPVGFALENIIDIAFLIIISAITLVFAWTSKEINRKEGIIMLVLYAAYMVYICMR